MTQHNFVDGVISSYRQCILCGMMIRYPYYPEGPVFMVLDNNYSAVEAPLTCEEYDVFIVSQS